MFFLRHCDRNSVKAVLFSIGEVFGRPVRLRRLSLSDRNARRLSRFI